MLVNTQNKNSEVVHMDLLNVTQLAQQYPFSESALRNLLHHRKQNGLAGAVVKIGRRIYINKNEFDQWLNNQKEEEL